MLRKLGAPPPATAALFAALAQGLAIAAPRCVQGGEELTLAWVSIPREGGEPLVVRPGDAAVEALPDGPASNSKPQAPAELFARLFEKIRGMYQRAFRRRPWSNELLETLGFVIGADPASYVSDPEGLDFYHLRAGWVDARGALAPQETLDALATVLRRRWEAWVDPAITLVTLRGRFRDTEITPGNGDVDRALGNELEALVVAGIKDEGVRARRPADLARRIGYVLSRQPERFLGGADGELASFELEVRDPRRRVKHAAFGEGVVVRERDNGKLDVEFDDGVKVVLAGFVSTLGA